MGAFLIYFAAEAWNHACVYSLRYPACNAHAPYRHLWPVRLWNIFSTLSHKRHDFREKVIEHIMCVLIFSTNLIWSISHYNKNYAMYHHKYTQVFMQSARYACHVLMKLQFSRQDFEDYSDIKFHENPSSVSRLVPCGRAYKHDEANSRFSQFC